MSRAKAQAEVNLARDVTNTERAFYGCIGRERQAKASAPPLASVKGELASADVEKAEVLNEFKLSVVMTVWKEGMPYRGTQQT